MSLRSDRRWDFDVAPDELWQRLSAIDEYPTWWPWLRRFQPIGGFAEGARWACVVAPPLPYDVRFSVQLDRVEHGERVLATVTGDVQGHAVLTVDPTDAGSTARLVSDLRPTNRVLRGVRAVARPVVRWGHDWVLDQGERQFVEHALVVDDR